MGCASTPASPPSAPPSKGLSTAFPERPSTATPLREVSLADAFEFPLGARYDTYFHGLHSPSAIGSRSTLLLLSSRLLWRVSARGGFESGASSAASALWAGFCVRALSHCIKYRPNV